MKLDKRAEKKILAFVAKEHEPLWFDEWNGYVSMIRVGQPALMMIALRRGDVQVCVDLDAFAKAPAGFGWKIKNIKAMRIFVMGKLVPFIESIVHTEVKVKKIGECIW
jgi:hypothetical protein